MKSYIKLPKTKALSDSSIRKRQLSDDDWKNYIFYHILQYYKNVNNKDIQALIKKEIDKPNHEKAQIEREIKKQIRNWFKKNKIFSLHGFIINLEASAECNDEGYIDLKFEHSDWRHKYFSFEAKNLGKIKTTKPSVLINEYVFTTSKEKYNGGMYRFLTNKYACELNFGGMLGFVVGETKSDVVKKLTKKIETVYNNSPNGKLTDEKIILNSIAGNEMTFDTVHLRNNYLTNKAEKFYLHHIIMDFT